LLTLPAFDCFTSLTGSATATVAAPTLHLVNKVSEDTLLATDTAVRAAAATLSTTTAAAAATYDDTDASADATGAAVLATVPQQQQRNPARAGTIAKGM
jgi:hypothetical protein